MDAPQLLTEITRYCKGNANPANVAKYQRYFKEGYDAWGLDSGLTTSKAKALATTPGITLEVVLTAAPELVKSPKYESTSFAILLLLAFQKEWTLSTFETVERWFEIGFTNWAHTDFFCSEILPVFFKKKIITPEALGPWRFADNKFQRRAAVVGLIKPMKLSTDFKPWFDFIRPMMHDKAREVHQGLGWFLRETWKKQPLPTEEFLLRYKDTAPRLIFQYACEKMTPEQKQRFKKT